jgi:hypothetical protein
MGGIDGMLYLSHIMHKYIYIYIYFVFQIFLLLFNLMSSNL